MVDRAAGAVHSDRAHVAYVREQDTEPVAVDLGDGDVGHVRRFLGDPGQRAPGPQGFMVMLPPGYVGRAHFHEVDQFQVFFGGAGATYQRHEVPWAMLHFADAYTTYGPFQAGSADLHFFTLRAEATLGTHYMPESRDKLVRRGRRTMHLALEREVAPSPGARSVSTLLAEDDGLRMERVRLGARTELTPEATRDGAYLCVLDGTLARGGELVGPRTLGWWPPGASDTLAAGDDGVDLVLLSFPTRTVRAAG
jgi:hypothetical protein